jgi:hypothetical protein
VNIWKIVSLAAIVLCIGCGSTQLYRKGQPQNFPPVSEFNAGLETSWINAVDNYRKAMAPKGMVYDPVMRNYQPKLHSITP